ncbi:hypothetical protein PAAG_06787 [Paracoccidioides lutzii Pb01]|uniref:Uncharacterized protein n=1 Tax=Paracoccidioides lutzii (strain ATCC MYA-826 / Pb01) TaxID=502779 RepID=C1H7P6_PARBA|nr:hypothetical protein PAAG_06787 [Paracoccidioides lutzii Pb01]EEH36369.2 hypothetical protein PAAG_06787 [Paracoccidioides lutzii Pb01]
MSDLPHVSSSELWKDPDCAKPRPTVELHTPNTDRQPNHGQHLPYQDSEASASGEQPSNTPKAIRFSSVRGSEVQGKHTFLNETPKPLKSTTTEPQSEFGLAIAYNGPCIANIGISPGDKPSY